MANLERFEQLRLQTLPGLVQEELLEMIKSGQLPAGTRLNELELSKRLKVSRACVREAVRALEAASLLRLEKNRGVFVHEVSAQEAEELYLIRTGLDEMVGRILAPKISDAQIEELGLMLDRLERTSSLGVDHTFPLNIAFHDRLVQMAGNTTLLGIYRQVINRMHLLRRRSFSGGSDASHSEHRQILKALSTRDADTAVLAMRTHVRNGFARMKSANEGGMGEEAIALSSDRRLLRANAGSD